MHQKYFIFIALIRVIHSFTCGKSNVELDTKIINGTEARPHSWPWIVTIQHPIIGHFCGGSLIDSRYVLTAAHCFFSVFFDISIVYIGNHHLTDRFEQRTIDEIIRHPSYVSANGDPYDIVLLKLNESVDLTTYSPICLPTNKTSELESPGTSVIIAGWGVTDNGAESDVLLQTTLYIHDSSIPECYPFINDTHKQLCVGIMGGGTGSCSGDSGGPLIAKYDDRYYLVGVLSAGIAGCANTSSLYVRVSAFIDWICEQDSTMVQCSLSDDITVSTDTTQTVPIISVTKKNDRNKKRTIIIVATVVPTIVILVIAITIPFYLQMKSKKQNQMPQSFQNYLQPK